jgi:translation elongation factor EF-Tu-like GTPase
MFELGNPMRVLARIATLKTEDGGRRAPFTAKYRPNHNFGAADDRQFFVGQLEIPVGVWIYPGEIHDVVVTFAEAPELSDILQIGRSWRIQEGGQFVATAQLLAVLD